MTNSEIERALVIMKNAMDVIAKKITQLDNNQQYFHNQITFLLEKQGETSEIKEPTKGPDNEY